MALKGTGEVPDAPEFSFTKFLLTVQSLEDELAAAKQRAKKAASERDVARSQVNDLKEQFTACNAEMQKKVSDLQKDLQHWTARAKAAESEKEESSNQAAAVSSQLQNLISSRDSNQQALKEKQHKLDLEIGLKTEECNRMQQQLQSYSGLLIALETELARGREALTDAKALVSENCTLVSRHEQKLQGAIIDDERFLGKIRRQAAAFKAIRARLQEKEQALKQLTDAHEKATKHLASSEAEATALKKTVGLLETDLKEHISAKNTLLHSLQRSNALLAESRNAAEQHRITLDSMRLKLRALDAQAFEAAASDAVKVREQSTELAALRAEVGQLQRQISEGSASLAIAPSLEKQSPGEQDHTEGRQREDCCGQQTDARSNSDAAEPPAVAVVEQRQGRQSDAQIAGSNEGSQHQGHTPMTMNDEHGKAIQTSAEQRRLQTAAATPWKSAGSLTAKPTVAAQHASICDPTHDAQEALEGKPMQAATVTTVPSGALTAKPSLASQDSSRCQPSQENLRCPENVPMQVAGLQQVHACKSRPWEHSPGTSLEASATAFSADTPDELELDGDDSLPCAQQAQRVQHSPLKAIPDTSATQPATGKSNQAPPWINAGNTTGSVPLGAHSVFKVGGVSAQSAAQPPSRCLPTAQKWESKVGEASALAAAQTAPTGLIAAQGIKKHESGSVAGRATMDLDMEQGDERRGLARDRCEPSAKKPRTLQPDMQSTHAAQKSDQTSLAREPTEPIAKEPCTAQPDVESKDAASCEGGELAMSTNADQLSSSPCDVFASFTSFQDLSDDEGHLNETRAGVSISLECLASGRSPKRART
ncbi:hypothetical protein COCOBI_14-3460 [Coccomyxa sp. Obi]|nr:hypothetical protein COCOBI_14-3460 [Coccomyxa sp. Obi]